MEKIDKSALFKIGYGLYVLTASDGLRDNGMICNTVMQVTGEPARIGVAINKANYSHDLVRTSGKMNVNVLAQSAPFAVFELFGFHSGRDCDKFSQAAYTRSANGLTVLSQYCNAFFSLQVESYSDLGSHGLFVCSITEAQTFSSEETMTYSYYQQNVKPKPSIKKRGWVCKICGYVYEGDELPADFVCPLCKHPASDFEWFEGEAPAPAKAQPAAPAPGKRSWVCPICGYVYEGEEMPADFVCPICKVPGTEFTAQEPAAQEGKYVCDICGYIYDPAVGDPEHGIPAGTPFEQLPEDWKCPVCGMGKGSFRQA